MKFLCDECNLFVEFYISDPIPSVSIDVMFSIFCVPENHYIARIDYITADVLMEALNNE